jgi:hypothetical protein
MAGLEQFIKHKYLNLETFHHNGASIKTPVWFVQEGEIIYVQKVANSGKVSASITTGMSISPLARWMEHPWVPGSRRMPWRLSVGSSQIR